MICDEIKKRKKTRQKKKRTNSACKETRVIKSLGDEESADPNERVEMCCSWTSYLDHLLSFLIDEVQMKPCFVMTTCIQRFPRNGKYTNLIHHQKAATPPRNTIEIFCNQINLLRNNDTKKSENDLFGDAPLLAQM